MNDKFETAESCRHTLLCIGDKALRALPEDSAAKSYKRTFGYLLHDYSLTLPKCIFVDVKAEVVAHLRLKYGAINMNWLINDDEDELPF